VTAFDNGPAAIADGIPARTLAENGAMRSIVIFSNEINSMT